ncbi:MAG: DEAD/DEAH box helicase [candidate division WOR-3 bacterium]
MNFQIKKLLPKTYFPFLGRFSALTEVQMKAIPEIMQYKDVLVISPSASGKTEAVVAPLLEQALSENCAGLRILYISPTRALVNDLYRRLLEPVNYLGLTIERKTGDYPQISEKKLPYIILTTPESFDSLLCRHPKIFLTLHGVILDELHLLHGTPRGDQLRILLKRLERILGGRKICCAALSATIDDFQIANYYFPDPQKISVISVPERRLLDYKLIPAHKGYLTELITEFITKGFRKILWFFNARSLVEEFMLKLKKLSPPYPVLGHHSSLSKKERESIEHFMNTSSRAILCATSTLELGIDIGDIDCVVQYRPPPNVSSLLQRIGRGNRRNHERLYTIGIYASLLDRIVFETFFECARDGKLYTRPYLPSLAVLPQQIFSYAYQRRRVGLTFEAFNNVTNHYLDDFEIKSKVFEFTVQKGYLREVRRGIYFLTEKLEKKLTYGKIHSNIQEKSFGAYAVYDAESGRFLGQIFYLSERFILGGKTYEVLRIDEKEFKVFVRHLEDEIGSTKIFEGTGALGYHYQMIPLFIKKIFPNLSQTGFPYFVKANQTAIIHTLGGLYSFIIKQALKKEGIRVTDFEGVMFVFDWPHLTYFPVPEKQTIREVINENLFRLEDNLGSGAFFRYLPRELQIEEHYRALDIDGLLDFISSWPLVRISIDDMINLDPQTLSNTSKIEN